MKKALGIFALVLAGVYIIFSSLGQKSEYSAERSLWQTNQKFHYVTESPNTTPERTFQEIIQQYENFIKEFPQSKLVPTAEVFLGRVYLVRGEHVKAREQWERVVQSYAQNPDICVQAVSDIGRSYAKEQDWDNVFKTYQRILHDYPLTEPGLETPLLIAQLYVNQKNIGKAQNAFQEAIDYYKSLSQKYPQSAVEYAALQLLANCYMAQDKFEEGVKTLGEILLKYPQPQYLTTQRAESLLKSINTISRDELKDFDSAIAIYSEFMQKYPQHPLSKFLAGIIQELKELKAKGNSAPPKK